MGKVSSLIWFPGVLIALLSALNAICWGFAVREVGDPQLSLDFLLRLAFNKWYVFALASALVASFLSYVVLREMGVLTGRFFLSLGTIATILACTLVLGEELTPRGWAGVTLIWRALLSWKRW